MAYGICRCCQRKRGIYCSELCRTCHGTPGVRERFPPLSAAAYRAGKRGEVPDFNGGYTLPQRPTSKPAGSARKLRVLANRVRARVNLFHPGDCEDVKVRADVGRDPKHLTGKVRGESVRAEPYERHAYPVHVTGGMR